MAPIVVTIFLDIDGVLLPFPEDNVTIKPGRIFPDSTLSCLDRILSRFPDHHLVLSSTWRVSQEQQDLILGDFAKYGGKLRDAYFHDITDPNYHSERQHEIHKYVRKHEVECWIALDDEELLEGKSNAELRSEFMGHVVFCISNVGLTPGNVEEAIRLVEHQQKQQVDS